MVRLYVLVRCDLSVLLVVNEGGVILLVVVMMVVLLGFPLYITL